jgi:hypothetical protein
MESRGATANAARTMAQPQNPAGRFGATTLVRSSRFRFGGFRARGVPAILCGAAAIVLAAGMGEALRRAVSVIPETLRETRLLLAEIRPQRPDYLPK